MSRLQSQVKSLCLSEQLYHFQDKRHVVKYYFVPLTNKKEERKSQKEEMELYKWPLAIDRGRQHEVKLKRHCKEKPLNVQVGRKQKVVFLSSF